MVISITNCYIRFTLLYFTVPAHSSHRWFRRSPRCSCAIFGSDFTVSGCCIHFTQALVKRMHKSCPVNAFRDDSCLQTLFRCQKFVFNSPLSQFILSLALAIDRAYSGRIFAFQTFQTPAISTPAFSTPAVKCRVFYPCSRVPRFPLPRFSSDPRLFLHFLLLRSADSAPAFPLLHFHPRNFDGIAFSLII